MTSRILRKIISKVVNWRARAWTVIKRKLIKRGNTRCVCMTARNCRCVIPIDILERIRADCPALHSLFLPEDEWSKFKEWHERPHRSVAGHRSYLLLALQGGCLARLTGPIHRYLISNETLRSDVRRQYVKDMRERWMFYSESLERHRKSRMFAGRIVEIQFAEWIETTLGWTIIGLEALREGPDIEATSASGVDTAFEVKAIGTEDGDFEIMLRSLEHGPSGGAFSLYSAINYLLLRVYEAAKQLAQYDGRRIAVVVIDDVTWWRFSLQLKQSWIDWASPSFFDNDTPTKTYLEDLESRFPEILTDVAPAVAEIAAVWIIRRSDGFEYNLEYEISTGHF